jgi:hypothetical protein
MPSGRIRRSRLLEVIGMEPRIRSAAPAWIGLALIVAGFLAYVGAYLLLPLYVTTWLTCFDVCGPPVSRTTWDFSIHLLSIFAIAPIANTLVLVLLHLPLLAMAVGVGCNLVDSVFARHAFAAWSTGAWIIGAIALFLTLFVLLLGGRPDWGYLGMLIGYALSWAGSRVLLTAHSQPQVAA